eukprot:12342989-Heterocapsa_arctica.AAC.1
MPGHRQATWREAFSCVWFGFGLPPSWCNGHGHWEAHVEEEVQTYIEEGQWSRLAASFTGAGLV